MQTKDLVTWGLILFLIWKNSNDNANGDCGCGGGVSCGGGVAPCPTDDNYPIWLQQKRCTMLQPFGLNI